MPVPTVRLATLAAGLALAGCATSAPAGSRSGSAAPGTASASAPDAATAAQEARYWATVASRRRATPADAAFMTGMIAHHAQALVMAAWAPTHGAGAELRRLAARIDNAQRDEIATMQRWLTDRGQPAPVVHEMDGRLMVMMPEAAGGPDAHSGHGGMDHGSGHDAHGGMHHDMPGMLTEAQLAQLDAARGVEFDRLFLTFMIQHHGGAVSMVDDLFATDGAAQDTETYKLASDIQVDQRTEIARMQRMLDALPPATGR